jgi:hypothetical protein
MSAQQARSDPPHQPGGDIGAPAQADVAKHVERADDKPAGGCFQVVQPMTSGLDAQFRIGLDQTRLQFLNEGQVVGGAVVDRLEADAAAAASLTLLPVRENKTKFQ